MGFTKNLRKASRSSKSDIWPLLLAREKHLNILKLKSQELSFQQHLEWFPLKSQQKASTKTCKFEIICTELINELINQSDQLEIFLAVIEQVGYVLNVNRHESSLCF